MKKIWKLCLSITLFFSFLTVCNASNIKTYTYEAPASLKSSNYPLNSSTYSTEGPSAVYDFFDESGYYNVVYTSNTTVYWWTYEKDMTVKKTRSWPMLYQSDGLTPAYEMFFYGVGGAIYEDGYLYVVYATPAVSDTITDRYEKNVLAIGKYDETGKEVKLQEYQGKYLNASGRVGDFSSGMQIPYYTASSSMTIQNGVLTLFFGGNMYNAHQGSLLMYIDTNTLEHVSSIQNENLATEYRHMYSSSALHTISHSLGQRVIKTSDGGYLLMEVGDVGSTRGLMLSKIYPDYYEDSDGGFNYLHLETKRVAHFTEGGAGTYAYNNTNQALGSLIEVDDGYLYIGAMDQILSASYGYSMSNPWDLFVQKYTKDFYLKNDAEMMMLDTPVRNVTGEKSEYNGYGRLYLTGDEKDYGMKWLTNLSGESIMLVRATKLSDGNILILWEQSKITASSSGGYYPSGGASYYYMVIDKDANVVVEPTLMENVSLNNEEHYEEKGGILYWTTTKGKNITIYELNIYHAIEKITLNKTSLDLEVQDSFKLAATLTPEDTLMDKTITWTSSNPFIASVSKDGVVTAHYPGKTTITATTINNKSVSIPVTVTGDVPVLKGDMNYSGKIELADFILGLRYYLGTYNNEEDMMDIYDMNGNNKKELGDAILILRAYLYE